SYGNRTKATTRNCNGTGVEASAPTPSDNPAIIASRESTEAFAAGSTIIGNSTYTWPAGRYPTPSTNASSHSETKEYDPRFDVVTRLTGPNGLVTSWHYDWFARKTRELRPDGTSTEWVYLLCTPGTCTYSPQNNGAWYVITRQYDSAGTYLSSQDAYTVY